MAERKKTNTQQKETQKYITQARQTERKTDRTKERTTQIKKVRQK